MANDYKFKAIFTRSIFAFFLLLSSFFSGKADQITTKGIVIEAQLNDNSIHLSWNFKQLNTQIAHYTVMSSVDGLTYFELYAANLDLENQNQQFQYTISPLGRINYFYIKASDIDGTPLYSAITACSAKANPLTIFPNPATAQVQFVANAAQEQQVAFHLYTDQGQLIRTEQMLLKKGSTRRPYDVSKLAKGCYYIRANFDGKNINVRFLKN